MAIDFKTLIGVAFDSNQAQSALQKQITSLKKSAKLALDLELSDGQAKKVIQDSSKAWSQYRKEAVSAITAPNAELKKMKQFYIDQEKELQNQISSQKQLYLETEKAYKLNQKYNQNQSNLGIDKSRLDNSITSFLSNNTKLSKGLQEDLIGIRTQIAAVDNASGLKNLDKQFKEVTSRAEAFGQTGDSVFARLKKNSLQFLNYLGSATLIMGSINSIKKMISNVYELDTAMTNLYKVTDETSAKYASFLDNANKKAQELGRSVSSLVEQTANWAKLGYGIDDAAKLAEVSSVYANVGEVDDDTAVADLVTIMKSLNIEASKSISIVDKLNAVSNNYAVSAADLGTGLKNSISAMSLAGNDLDQTIAMLTAMSEITQDASESGNAIKVLSMRLRGAETDLAGMGESTDGVIKSVSTLRSTIEALTAVNGRGGFDIMLDDGTFKSTYEIMEGISKVWKDISDVDQANLLQVIAGKQRGNSIAALLTNMAKANDVLSTSINSSGSAMEEQERWLSSLEAKLNQNKAAFQSLSSTVVDSDFLKGSVDLGTDFINILDTIIDKLGLFPVLMAAMSGALSTKNIGIFSLDDNNNITNVFSELINKSRLVKTSVDDVSVSIENYNTKIRNNAVELEKFNNSVSNDTMSSYLQSLKGGEASLQGYNASLKTATISSVGLKAATVALNMALTMGLSFAVQGLFTLISDLVNAQDLALDKSAELTNAYKSETSQITNQISSYKELKKQLDTGNLSVDETKTVKEQLIDIQKNLSDSYDIEAEKLDLVNGKYEDQIKVLNNLSKQTAQNYLAENKLGYENSKDYLSDTRGYKLTGFSGINMSDDLESYLKNYSDEFFLRVMGDRSGETFFNGNIEFTLNNMSVEKAKETLTRLYNDIDEKFGDGKDAEKLKESISKVLNTEFDDSKIDKAKESVSSYVEAQVVANNTLRNLYTESENAIDNYNNALISGKNIDEAKSNLDRIKESVSNNTHLVEGSEKIFESLFETISNGSVDVSNSLVELELDTSFSDVITNNESAIEDFRKNIKSIQTALSDLSKLSSDDILGLMNQFPQLAEYGFTGSEGINALRTALLQLVKAQYQSLDSTLQQSEAFKKMYNDTIDLASSTEDLSNSINTLNTFNSSLNSLDSAYASLVEKEFVSIDVLNSLSDTFSNTEGFDKFISTISSATSLTDDVQIAFNNLITSYIYGTDVLDNLDESNKSLVITQLQHIGITNADEIVTKRLAEQKAILAETGVDVKNATAEEIIELINEGNVSEDTRIALTNLAAQKLNVNDISLSTSGDIQNLISLMSITNATTEALQALQLAKSGDVPMSVARPGDMESMYARAQAEVEAYYKSLGNYQNVSYTGGSKSTSSKNKSSKDKTKKEFSQVFDWIAIRIDKLKEKAQKAIDDVGKFISYKKQNKQLDLAIDIKVDEQKSLKTLQKSYEKMASEVDLSKKYRDLVDNGGINVQTITDEKLASKIEEYQKWRDAASDVSDEISSINNEIKELSSQKLDNITDFYSNRISFLSSNISNKESAIAYKQNAGKDVKESDYNYLISIQNKIIANTKKEIDAYSKLFNEQVKSGEITIGSPEYYEGKEKLNELTAATRDARSAIYDYKAEIRELRWDSFDDGITKINNAKNELSDLADLIRSSDVLDDNGNYTEVGLTKLGLLSQQMAQNSRLVSEYGVAIKTLSQELKNGVITQEQYDEELANYQSLQLQAVKDNLALEDSIAEIAKQRVQYEIDAINKETDAFKELVDAKKKALQAEKDLHDYQTSINKKQKSIDTLQRQISALKLSSDRKDIAQRLKLEEQLREQQTELEEEQLDHAYDVQMNAYDDEYDAYKKSQDEKISALEKSLEDQEALVKSALEEVFANTTEISTGIQMLASEHGLTVTESIVTPWQSATTAIEIYKAALESIPKTNTTIDYGSISGDVSSSSSSSKTSSSNTTTNPVSDSSSSSATSKTSISSKTKFPISTVKYTGNKSTLNKDSSVIDRLKYFDLDSSVSARGTLYKYFGLSGSYNGSSSQNNNLITAMKKAGFNQGGTGKLVNSLEDEGFTLMKRDEAMLSSEQTKSFKDMLAYTPYIKTLAESVIGNNIQPSVSGGNSVNIQYDSLINVHGSVDSSNIKQLEQIAKDAVDRSNKQLLTLIGQRK